MSQFVPQLPVSSGGEEQSWSDLFTAVNPLDLPYLPNHMYVLCATTTTTCSFLEDVILYNYNKFDAQT